MTETNNQSTEMADLAAPDADQIKGGPTPKSRRNVLLQSSATDQSNALADLEPQGEIKGGSYGTGTSGGVYLNHNETVAVDREEEDEATTARLIDLSVGDEQADATKGGLLLPAVQKVREAAARMSC